MIVQNLLNRLLFAGFLAVFFAGVGCLGWHYGHYTWSQAQTPALSTAEILRVRHLTHQLRQAELKNAHLTFEATALSVRVNRFYRDTQDAQLLTLSRALGLAPLSGEGVVITLNDSDKPFLLDLNPNSGILHNTDLVAVVNQLWSADAQAIAINGHRVTEKTAITCDGPIIFLDHTRIAPPFRLEALGNPARLSQQLDAKDGYLTVLKNAGLGVSMKPQPQLALPAAS